MINRHNEKAELGIKYHYSELLKIFPKEQIFFIALQGSQNYNLDYKNSDIDTKALIIPTIEDFALNKPPVSYTHVLENGEHIDIKDIRLMFNEWWKENINFLEILFTPYVIINQDYIDFYNQLSDLKEYIVTYDPMRFVFSMAGHAKEKYIQLLHERPGNEKDFSTVGYDTKALCHLLRIEEHLEYFSKNYWYPFESLLTTHKKYSREELIGIKEGKITKDTAIVVADRSIENINKIREAVKNTWDKIPIANGIKDEVENILVQIIKKSLVLQLK